MFDKLKIKILGSGTSTGVPLISCDCPTCLSDDPRDKRLRTSIMLTYGDTRVVVDTTPDFRQQMIASNVKKLDGILYTHAHFDHIAGFDDLRAFNFTSRLPMDIYSTSETFTKIKNTFLYAFGSAEQIGGGVPQIQHRSIEPYVPFFVKELEILPLRLMHGKLEVIGFRIGSFAYLTDTNFIPEKTYKYLDGLEILIIDALRINPHPTHFCISETLEAIKRLNPAKAYFIHIAHEIKHAECEGNLPRNIQICYDGMEFEI